MPSNGTLLVSTRVNHKRIVMKKSVYITLFIVLASAAGVMAQQVSFVASFGAPRAWDVPPAISHVVYHDYYQYDWVHASRHAHHGHWNYNIILQRGNSFVELNLNRFGHVKSMRTFNHYPLAGHVCSGQCGYHSYYYNSFHASCNSPYHYGHNHVIFSPRPVNYVWGHYYDYPSYNKVVYHKTVVKKSPKYYKGYDKKDYRHVDNHRDQRYVRRDRYPSRRQGTIRELEEARRDDRWEGKDVRGGRKGNHGKRGRR
jgi:hypothetical protein